MSINSNLIFKFANLLFMDSVPTVLILNTLYVASIVSVQPAPSAWKVDASPSRPLFTSWA